MVPMSSSFAGGGLRDRRAEREVLDRLLAEARAGRSRALVLRGEAGVGKTGLLNYVHEQASGFRVARAVYGEGCAASSGAWKRASS